MPQYNTSGTNNITLNPIAATVLWPGDQVYLFGTAVQTPGQIAAPNDSNVQPEAVNVGERSIAIALAPRPSGGSPPGIMVQVIANANPGVAEIDVQDAAMDADGAYLTNSGAAAASYKLTVWTQIGGSANWISTTELEPEAGAFITLKCIANPNAVKFTAKVVYV